MSIYGDCIVTRVHCGTDAEHVRVDRADPVILISAELIGECLAGRTLPYLRAEEGGIIAIGTPGLGKGRVYYQVGDRHDQYSFVATRLDAP